MPSFAARLTVAVLAISLSASGCFATPPRQSAQGSPPAGAVPGSTSSPSGDQRPIDSGSVTVMTQNLYIGADLAPVLAAQTLPAVTRAAAAVFAHVRQTDFPARADAIAREVARERPDLIGLQECALWETAPIGRPLRTAYDFLAMMLAALGRHGLHYRAVVVNRNAQAAAPLGRELVRFTDRDAILLRDDSPWQAGATKTHTYPAVLHVHGAAGLSLAVPRGWAGMELTRFGRPAALVVDTHLEAYDAGIRRLQARELAFETRKQTVILLGDINSRPDDRAGAYGTLRHDGFADAWAEVHGGAGGYTSGQQDSLRNLPSRLDHRIDVVMLRGGPVATAARVVGDRPGDRTPGGLWPSDHAGVVARVSFG